MKICILGSGAYGSALAVILNENKNSVYLWSPFKKEIQTFKENREPLKLPGIKLDKDIVITNNIEEATTGADFIVLAIPTAFVRNTLKKIKKCFRLKLQASLNTGHEFSRLLQPVPTWLNLFSYGPCLTSVSI